MAQTKAGLLLIDFGVERTLAFQLKKLIESFVGCTGQLQLDCTELSHPSLHDADLASAAAPLRPDVIFLVLSPDPEKQFITLFNSVKRSLSDTPILVVMDAGDADQMFSLVEIGATSVITPPLKAIDVFPRICRLFAQPCPEQALTESLKEKIGLRQLLGESPVFIAEIKKIPVIAKCDAGVLISGETGTGKELCARAIHYLGPRAHKPFIPVNCGAIPGELVENELFGHERGAFTGASNPQPGLIHEADGGTLFLDEIDCLPLLAQVKLLRFLQEKEYRRLGSTKTHRADVRLIAATNSALENAVVDGRLRQDLYFRLNVVPIHLPPLRNRQEDIPLLARHFLEKYSREFGRGEMDFSLDAIKSLLFYDWPGNVRELEYVIERAVVLSEEKTIRSTELSLPQKNPDNAQESFKAAKSRIVSEFEKSYVQGLLLSYHGNISKSAQAAQKDRRAFFHLVRKHRIDVQRFK
jgi:DNA-binding NtrC family response regulator